MKNNLWKSKYKPKFGVRLAKIKRDPLCDYCCKLATCSPGPCFFLSRINGNVPSKEILLSDISNKEIEYVDYNHILAEGIESRRTDYSRSKTEKLKVRCVASLLEADFTIIEIAKILKCSIRNIYRLRIK